MPELPEVENIRRSIAPLVLGKRIQGVEILYPNIVGGNEAEFEDAVTGQMIEGLERRGKYLIFKLTKGWLLLHFRMTGQLLGGTSLDCHTHLRFHFEDETIVSYRDVRKFGGFKYFSNEESLLDYLNQRLGLEPLEMTFEEFSEGLKKAKGIMKKVLLDQSFIAGIGNIYADEILFVSGIHPEKKAKHLTKQQKVRLFESIQSVLSTAIDEGGSSIRDYVNSQGEKRWISRTPSSLWKKKDSLVIAVKVYLRVKS